MCVCVRCRDPPRANFRFHAFKQKHFIQININSFIRFAIYSFCFAFTSDVKFQIQQTPNKLHKFVLFSPLLSCVYSPSHFYFYFARFLCIISFVLRNHLNNLPRAPLAHIRLNYQWNFNWIDICGPSKKKRRKKCTQQQCNIFNIHKSEYERKRERERNTMTFLMNAQ